MRVLVTRPVAQAAMTARRLVQNGHEPLIASVTIVEAVAGLWPEGVIDAVLATSPNALRLAPAERVAVLAACPIHVVGLATGEAARKAGFRDVRPSSGHASALADDVLAATAPGHRLLYLAGVPRKPVLEDVLAREGREVVPVVLYHAVSAPDLGAATRQALAAGAVDAVLHHSREAAARFVALAVAAGLQGPVRILRHLCLSGDVAEGLAGLEPLHIEVAMTPDDAALLALLDQHR